jgi:hypothetical protein
MTGRLVPGARWRRPTDPAGTATRVLNVPKPVGFVRNVVSPEMIVRLAGSAPGVACRKRTSASAKAPGVGSRTVAAGTIAKGSSRRSERMHGR